MCIRDRVARVLRLPAGTGVSEQAPLVDMGLDSLMAVELRNALSAGIGRTLPAALVYDHPTLALLSEYVHHLAVPSPVAAPPAPAVAVQAVPVSEPVDQLEEMTQDDIARLLADRLAALKDAS